jgi:hypothetical protein
MATGVQVEVLSSVKRAWNLCHQAPLMLRAFPRTARVSLLMESRGRSSLMGPLLMESRSLIRVGTPPLVADTAHPLYLLLEAR